MDHYDCHQNTKFQITRTFFDNSKRSQDFKIKFEFSFNEEILNWIVHQNSTRPLEFIGFGDPNLSFDLPPLVVTLVGEASSWEVIREAVGKAVGSHLSDDEIDYLMGLVREGACKCFNTETLPRHGVLGLACKIFIQHSHVYGVETDDCRGPVPAADSSFKLLEKCEINDKESCCSICLEELGGGGEVLRMPCLHVFHGGCIEKWLRRSHYCPLCRYEMPTEEI